MYKIFVEILNCQNFLLMTDQRMSFFESTFRKHKEFAKASKPNIKFGQTIHFHLPKSGDWNVCFKCGKQMGGSCDECEYFCSCHVIKIVLPPIRCKEVD